ncbi:TPA: hypothetical protein ACTW8Y_000513 [Raoultella ornithinolytica]
MTTDITELARERLKEKFDAWFEREYKHLESSKYTDAVPHIKYGFWTAYQAGGAELVEALEKAQRANAAQDDHINQQQDRIEQLEKGCQHAAKRINSWRRLAKQNIAEREKDISELEAARGRIAELESRLVSADKLQDSAFRSGLQHGFSLGQTDDQKGYEQSIAAYGPRGKGNG